MLQDESERFSQIANTIGLKINEEKTYAPYENITDADHVTLNDKPIANAENNDGCRLH